MRVVVAAVVLLLLVAPPASAHGGAGNPSSNHRPEIVEIEPSSGIRVRLVDARTRVEVDAGDHEVVVLGYEGEPYLRIGGGVVEENRRSPAAYLNDALDAPAPPPEADASAEPSWAEIGRGSVARWHDHALHPAPSQVELGRDIEWELRLEVDGEPVSVRGVTSILDGRSTGPWSALAGAVAVVGTVLAARRPGVVVALLALAVAADGARVAGLVLGMPTWIESRVDAFVDAGVAATVAWVLALVGGVLLARGRRYEAFAAAVVAGGLVAVVGGAIELRHLGDADLGSALPDAVARAAVAIALGAGAAASLGASYALSVRRRATA